MSATPSLPPSKEAHVSWLNDVFVNNNVYTCQLTDGVDG